MGWSSGTEIFEDVVSAAVDQYGEIEIGSGEFYILLTLFKALRNKDWDEYDDCIYWEYGFYQEILKREGDR